jgi:hypothetical protein
MAAGMGVADLANRARQPQHYTVNVDQALTDLIQQSACEGK